MNNFLPTAVRGAARSAITEPAAPLRLLAGALGAVLLLALVATTVAAHTVAEAAIATGVSSSAITQAPLSVSGDTAAATTSAPQCPDGQLPVLQNAVHPAAGTRSGPASPEAALRASRPALGPVSMYPWFPQVASSRGPVWIVAGNETFLATALPDGGWFVSPSKFVGCKSLPDSKMTSR